MLYKTKKIILPALELDINHLLRIITDYVLINEPSTFLPFLKAELPPKMQKLFWQAYQHTHEFELLSRYYPSHIAQGTMALIPMEVYQLYVTLIVYLKEYQEQDFLQFIASKWPKSRQKYFWELYGYLVDILYSHHMPWFQQTTTYDLEPLHHYHVLLLLLDYLFSDGNPDPDLEASRFLCDLRLTNDPAVQQSVINTRVNIRQNLLEYHGRCNGLLDLEQAELDYIMSM